MPKMGLNIVGRIKNFNLAPQQTFLTVLETVVNSVHSIIERMEVDPSFKNGWIKIYVKRNETLVENVKDVESIVIVDNGIGFTEDNMESFLTADSAYKAEIGGKGIGRFSWLKAFSTVEIESIYKDYISNEVPSKRSFIFSLKNISKGELEVEDQLEDYKDCYEDNQTTVKLLLPKGKYKSGLKLTTETMVLRLIEHCIEYILKHSNIEIRLIDDEAIVINDRINKAIIRQETASFSVSKEQFTIQHLFILKSVLKNNYIYWSGNQRIVTKNKLEQYLPNTKGVGFVNDTVNYIAVISGEFLDEAVGDNRMVFNLPSDEYEEDNLFSDIITLKDIVKVAKNNITAFLKDEIKLIQDQSETRVRKYIISDAPEYNYLLKYNLEEIRQLGSKINDDKLESALHELEVKHNRKIVNDLKSLQLDKSLNLPEYQVRFKETVAKISESNKAKLIEYVSHRKVILELFEDGLKTEDDRYKNEAYIHNLIYPMKGTQNHVMEPLHNLWLIDERLAFCEYIASDLPLEPKSSRPDLLFLDKSVALSDEDTPSIYNTISIVELKRPMRTGYTEIDNPMIQMIKYVRQIGTGKCKTKDGRPIAVGNNTKFYLYAICDIDDSLRGILQNSDYNITADGEGYYTYNKNINAHIEIIPFDKVVRNARQRNKMFFKQLGI